MPFPSHPVLSPTLFFPGVLTAEMEQVWYTARWPLRRGPLGFTYYRVSQKRSIFAGEMYSTILCRMGWWSFWSWFDANRSTFDEDMHENDFCYIFVVTDLDV